MVYTKIFRGLMVSIEKMITLPGITYENKSCSIRHNKEVVSFLKVKRSNLNYTYLCMLYNQDIYNHLEVGIVAAIRTSR